MRALGAIGGLIGLLIGERFDVEVKDAQRKRRRHVQDEATLIPAIVGGRKA
jgi:hypothetical protein